MQSSSNGSESDAWVEKQPTQTAAPEREDWMAMTGMLKTYTKDDIHPKKEHKEKNHINSYNPATSTRELNPYWKDGGGGLPQTSDSLRKSRQFLKPSDDDDLYTKRSSINNRRSSNHITYDLSKNSDGSDYSSKSTRKDEHYAKSYNVYSSDRTSNWRKGESSNSRNSYRPKEESPRTPENYEKSGHSSQSKDIDKIDQSKPVKDIDNLYLSDEKMNKLGAKIVKAEIMGDLKLVGELKAKLDAAREYRKQNPNAGKEDDRVMLTSTNSSGNTRPLTQAQGDARSKGGKRKAETHVSGERAKYFGNDDKYNLAQMVRFCVVII